MLLAYLVSRGVDALAHRDEPVSHCKGDYLYIQRIKNHLVQYLRFFLPPKDEYLFMSVADSC
jgi:hypothetical protein